MLEFSADNTVSDAGAFTLVDEQTGSRWSWLTGTAIDGPLAGRELEPMTHHPILNRRFHGFYPDAPVME